LTDVSKGALAGALVGAVDTVARVAGAAKDDKSKAGGSVSKSKNSSSNTKTTANKKTKSGK